MVINGEYAFHCTPNAPILMTCKTTDDGTLVRVFLSVLHAILDEAMGNEETEPHIRRKYTTSIVCDGTATYKPQDTYNKALSTGVHVRIIHKASYCSRWCKTERHQSPTTSECRLPHGIWHRTTIHPTKRSITSSEIKIFEDTTIQLERWWTIPPSHATIPPNDTAPTQCMNIGFYSRWGR